MIFKHPFCRQTSKTIERGALSKKNSKKVSQRQKTLKGETEKVPFVSLIKVPKKRESLTVSKKVERGTLMLWIGFLSHVRGFGCVENEVLTANGKSA